jgi:hypothetical protein
MILHSWGLRGAPQTAAPNVKRDALSRLSRWKDTSVFLEVGITPPYVR